MYMCVRVLVSLLLLVCVQLFFGDKNHEKKAKKNESSKKINSVVENIPVDPSPSVSPRINGPIFSPMMFYDDFF